LFQIDINLPSGNPECGSGLIFSNKSGNPKPYTGLLHSASPAFPLIPTLSCDPVMSSRCILQPIRLPGSVACERQYAREAELARN
ncbi:unnamed protein product, partial [Staurois parvus]